MRSSSEARRRRPGAVLLAGVAALRVGAGVPALAVPEAVAVPLAVAVPEAGVTPLTGDIAGLIRQADAVLIGPGFDSPDVTRKVLTDVVAALPGGVPVVLDAFALGVLPELGRRLTGRVVLTPNTKEAQLLLGGDEADDLDEDAGPRIAQAWQATVSYQGVVATPRRLDPPGDHRPRRARHLRQRRRPRWGLGRAPRPWCDTGSGRQLGDLPARCRR